MRNRCTTLWLSLLVVALLGLASGVHASQYAVVANSGNGTVSLMQNSGSGWLGVGGSALSVGGTPWGVAATDQYAFVANNSGYLNVVQASVNDQGNASLVSIQQLDFGDKVDWVAAGSNEKIYVTTRVGNGGALHVLTRSSDVWSKSLLSAWDEFLPRGLAIVGEGATQGVAVSTIDTSFNSQLQVFREGASPVSHALDGYLRPTHVASWIQQFALVARQSELVVPPPETTAGHLTAVNVVSGATSYLELNYVPYEVAVIGDHAYVTNFNSARIYKYLLSLEGDVPTMTQVASLSVGSEGTVRKIVDSGDGYLLVTSNAGGTVHSISLSNFTAGGISNVGTFSYPVGIGVIKPVMEPVPEPSALATLATGLLAVAGRALRRKGRRKEG